MRKRIAVALLLAAFAPGGYAADLPTLEHAALVLGVERISSLEFEASGTYFQFGQAPAPELPWPAFDVQNYQATLDYARAAVHAKYHRVQVVERGRERPHSEQTMDQYAAAGFTWNMTPGATSIPTNLAERNAELWASPQGFIKAARAHAATLRARQNGDIAVTFALDGKYRYEGVVSPAGEVRSVRTLMDSPVLGDTPIEWRYSDYEDFDRVRFPARIERFVAGMPWYDLTVSAVRINGAAPFPVPAEVSANPVPTMDNIEVTELAPGVFNFGGTSHNSVVVEQRVGVVVIEAPLNEQRSAAVIAKVREMIPGKPITNVINTHAHFDHAGGLRTFADAGIQIITHARNASYYERAWRQPRAINPDRLAQSKRKPKFRNFTTKLALPDGERPIEIHTIVGSGHNDAFGMVYLPAQKILVEADAWTPAAAGVPPPATVNPLWLNLLQNIERLEIDVQRVAPLHGSVRTIEELRLAVTPITKN